MNIIVCAKQVVDASEMKIDSSTKRPILQGLSQKISDIDKNAVEEAIKIKEKHGGKITVIMIGPANAKERIKELLAMGVDEGVIVTTSDTIDYHMTATLLAEAMKKIGSYDIILCGEASTDLFSGQIGPRVAGLLNIPQLTYAQSVTAEKDKVTANRNMGANAVTSESTYPVLITVTKEINDPRLPSLMQILAAANKPIQEWTAESLSSGLQPLVETIELKGVTMERKNVIYKDDLDESVNKLVDNLAKEGVLGR
ncbi:MAG: electron transfer flavoprotein subunit beta/FixA family protein [Candidatus Thermoplasmatota archaeon]|nr:electron transfer flavoprotein subunit beta/FixA family protein [Candidatus Thermoplasmatota archaeon]